MLSCITLTLTYALIQASAPHQHWSPLRSSKLTFDPLRPLAFAIKGRCDINLRTKLFFDDVVDLEFSDTSNIHICCKSSTPINSYNCRHEQRSWALPSCVGERYIIILLSTTNLRITISNTVVLDYIFNSNDGLCIVKTPKFVSTPSWSSEHYISLLIKGLCRIFITVSHTTTVSKSVTSLIRQMTGCCSSANYV